MCCCPMYMLHMLQHVLVRFEALAAQSMVIGIILSGAMRSRQCIA